MNRSARRPRGFTLIELLVALAVMALLAILSWRGLDGMARAEAQTRQRADELLVLQASLAQWRADLDALASGNAPSALDWDGRVLRLTRRGASLGDGLRVVAWTRRVDVSGGQWQRWQSPALRSQEAWQQAWSSAQAWAQAEDLARQVSLLPLADWQIFYFRGDAWTHPLSSDGSTTSSLPDGVRLVLTLPPGQAVHGQLTLDWASPTVGGGRS
ncbi:prepilin-type N-terminal cleavage/methylation domain-containing protein [Ramlibacter sp. 2FC]|uniref:PulJ/GspJ family protein n=1 Tax=Ramlibacter sp. 2FC TaxID=2502188 RepID=UPI0010F68B23|nr:prepilin-type N-terminal cleavage/methylation domain-containing protein [Ramlibacter sp. 2FC]